MNQWTRVDLSDRPDAVTRKAILYWTEQTARGRFRPVGQDATPAVPDEFSPAEHGVFGVAFERAEDARLFRRYWLRGR
jgi:hypothetical protein